MKINSIISFILSLYFCTIQSGFLPGTLINTPSGHIPIELLNVNDIIICHNQNNLPASSHVTHIWQHNTQHYIQIFIENEIISVTPEHLFYLPIQDCWIPANQLKEGDILLKNFTEYTTITHTEYVTDEVIVYDLSIALYHTFCVSSFHIKTHNIFPVIALTISFLFGGGIEFAGAALTAVLGGVGIAVALNKSKHSSSITISPIIPGTPSLDPGDPEEDPEKKRELNTVHKSEFFNSLKNEYEHYKNSIYRRKKHTKGIENAEYLKWDHLHNDVEAYASNRKHLGSICPRTHKLYRKPNHAAKLKL